MIYPEAIVFFFFLFFFFCFFVFLCVFCFVFCCFFFCCCFFCFFVFFFFYFLFCFPAKILAVMYLSTQSTYQKFRFSCIAEEICHFTVFRAFALEFSEYYYKHNWELKSPNRPALFENVSSGICGQRRPRLACTSVQSDQGLRCPLTASLYITEHINREQRPGLYLSHEQDVLNLHMLRMVNDTFSPHVAQYSIIMMRLPLAALFC